MSGNENGNSNLVGALLKAGQVALSLGACYYFYVKVQELMTGPAEVDNESIVRAAKAFKEFRGDDAQLPSFNRFELALLGDLVFPKQINVTLDDIGGLDTAKSTIWETIIFPFVHPHLYASERVSSLTPDQYKAPKGKNHLLSAPTGVLFYGPPGTGKTLMAKAIAKEAGCTFIIANFAQIQSKYYGETSKYIHALFSLARKCAPTIIFIDEVDVYLGKRGSNSHELSNHVIADFLTAWDGILSDNSNNILIVGATNRSYDLDEALLRRFGRQIFFDLPNEEERQNILHILLHEQVAYEDGLLEYVSARTRGYSGSDLKELCKFAAMQPVREFIYLHREAEREKQGGSIDQLRNPLSPVAPLYDNDTTTRPGSATSSIASSRHEGSTYQQHQRQAASRLARPRPVSHDDFDKALANVKPTGQQSQEELQAAVERESQHKHAANSGGASGNDSALVHLMATLMGAMAAKDDSTTRHERESQRSYRSNSNAAAYSTASSQRSPSEDGDIHTPYPSNTAASSSASFHHGLTQSAASQPYGGTAAGPGYGGHYPPPSRSGTGAPHYPHPHQPSTTASVHGYPPSTHSGAIPPYHAGHPGGAYPPYHQPPYYGGQRDFPDDQSYRSGYSAYYQPPPQQQHPPHPHPSYTPNHTPQKPRQTRGQSQTRQTATPARDSYINGTPHDDENEDDEDETVNTTHKHIGRKQPSSSSSSFQHGGFNSDDELTQNGPRQRSSTATGMHSKPITTKNGNGSSQPQPVVILPMSHPDRTESLNESATTTDRSAAQPHKIEHLD